MMLRHPVLSAEQRDMTPLPISICVVVGKCPQPQVGRVDASSDITGVENIKPYWDWTVSEYPGDPVGKFWDVVDADSPVSTLVSESGPKPALFGGSDTYAVPESFGERRVAVERSAGVGAEPVSSILDGEWRTAILTGLDKLFDSHDCTSIAKLVRTSAAGTASGPILSL